MLALTYAVWKDSAIGLTGISEKNTIYAVLLKLHLKYHWAAHASIINSSRNTVLFWHCVYCTFANKTMQTIAFTAMSTPHRTMSIMSMTIWKVSSGNNNSVTVDTSDAYPKSHRCFTLQFHGITSHMLK